MKIIIFSEVKQREFIPNILLKIELEKHGYKVKILNFLDSAMFHIKIFKPDIIINNGMRSDRNFYRLFVYPKNKFGTKILTIYAEQITANINKDGFYLNDKILKNTDAHIVWGSGFANILMKNQVIDKNKIYITGSHRLDILKLYDTFEAKNKLAKALKK